MCHTESHHEEDGRSEHEAFSGGMGHCYQPLLASVLRFIFNKHRHRAHADLQKMRNEQRRAYWWGTDELWRNLNNKWALFNQTKDS